MNDEQVLRYESARRYSFWVVLFLIALGYGLGPVFQKAGEGNYLQFLAPGIIGMSII